MASMATDTMAVMVASERVIAEHGIFLPQQIRTQKRNKIQIEGCDTAPVTCARCQPRYCSRCCGGGRSLLQPLSPSLPPPAYLAARRDSNSFHLSAARRRREMLCGRRQVRRLVRKVNLFYRTPLTCSFPLRSLQ